MIEQELKIFEEVREAINSIHKDIRIPHPSEKFPKGEIVVPWLTLATLDRVLFLGGFRISEVCTKPTKEDSGNTSDTLSLEVVTHHNTGEEALLFKVNTLKKKITVTREFALPLNQRHEPWTSMIYYQWSKNEGNPCALDRKTAWAANRLVFEGLQYKIKARAIYLKDESGKNLKDENGRSTIEREVKEHYHPGADHLLRHARAEELRHLQLTIEERVSFFKWSSQGFGLNPMLGTYSEPEWFDYFPKFLKYSREAS